MPFMKIRYAFKHHQLIGQTDGNTHISKTYVFGVKLLARSCLFHKKLSHFDPRF